ncbi:MAG: hypothetical protein HY514_04905 [Candidatus Aenigmarchaeota archaeon]|nr:hypothetical protein [Candidatus Aenigmarchaeota archaeon]
MMHPDLMNRYISNAAYLALICVGELAGKNTTYPFLPRSPGTGRFADFKYMYDM